jgi:uncharacterized damage-inducible protein DinB
MRRDDIATLFDYLYWANRRLLATATRLTTDRFVAPTDLTVRDLRATLVHELDVEWSWRLRLQGQPPERWGPDQELRPEDYPTVAVLAERWREDETEMRAWLETLDDADLERSFDDGELRLPLWYYLVHLIEHGAQQRAEVAVLLTAEGHSPGGIEFLDYVDDRESVGLALAGWSIA